MARDREDSSDLSPPPADLDIQPQQASPPTKRKRAVKDTDTAEKARNPKRTKQNQEQIDGPQPRVEGEDNQSVKSSRAEKSKDAISSDGGKEDTITETTEIKAKPKRTRKPQIKTEDDLEEAQEGEVEGTPKQKRQRKPKVGKAPNTEDGDVKGAPPTPKRKRKTAEEKAAEAMPLAPRTTNHLYNIGAHVSAAGGVHNAITNAVHIGANSLALFLKSQRKWANPALKPEHTDLFRSACTTHQYDAGKHALPHGSYLVNLAHSDPARKTQAYESFLDDLKRCEALGIRLYNFHPGNTASAPRADAIANLAAHINAAHAATTNVTLLLETMATSSTSNTLGGQGFTDLRDTIALVQDKSRIGVCLDTCHVFAAGHDLRSPEAFAATMQEFDRVVGAGYIKALHLNDSKAPLASHRDLHANIGTGFLGLRAFHNVMNHKAFEGLPMVLETPIDVPNPKVQEKGRSEVVKSEGVEDPAEDKKAAKGTAVKPDDKDPPKEEGSNKKATKPKPAKSPPKTIEDRNMWAREIKLLESLVGMDVNSPEFLKLEADLAAKGKASRAKHMEQFERKAAETEKKAEKATKKARTAKAKAKVMEESGSELSEIEEEDEANESEEEEKRESPGLPA